MKQRATIKSVLIALLSAVMLPAQQLQWFSDINGENSGHTVCGFLNLPAHPVSLARGTTSDPGTPATLSLPDRTAVTALADRYRFGFSHLEWLMGLRKESLFALFPVLDAGTFGGFAQLYTPGAFSNTRDIDEQPSNPSYLEYQVGATYARSFFGKRLSAGCALSFIESRIEEVTGRTVAGGIDIRYTPVPFLTTGLSGSSLGMPVAYNRSAPEPLPSRLGWTLSVRPIPMNHPLLRYIDPDIGIGIAKIADEPIKAGISTEMAIGPYVRIRTGYEYTKGEKPAWHGIGTGAGIKWESFELDGAWRYLSTEFGPVWSVALTHEREELKKRTAEDYYRIAEKHYKKHRFTFCSINARRALKLDPNMWKAHALLQRMKSDILRSQRREIALIYTGNARGNFTIPLEEGAPGGFARQAGAINALRARFPLAITVEAGNLVSRDMQPLRTAFAASYLDHIGYDVVGCGNEEFLFGFGKLSKTAGGNYQYLCSNTAAAPKGFIRHRIIEREGYRFFAASWLSPSFLPEDARERLLGVEKANLLNKAGNCDLRICIVNAPWEELRRLAPSFSGFDILICGSIDQRFASPMKLGNCTVLSAGSRGQYVGNLIIRFDENRKVTGMENRLIALDSRIIPDTVIARKLATFTANAGQPTTVSGKKREAEGTFVFTSDRDGKSDIFLKVTDQFAEFPLTGKIVDTCDAPVLSFAAGRIACRAQDGVCRRLLTMNLDGSDKRYTADSLEARAASFSPDGRWIYYAAAPCGDTVTDIYRVKTEGGPSFPVIAWPEATETAPVFSTDGTMMVFSSDRDGTFQLYLTNPEGELPLRITDEAANHFSPAFSPDGSMIAYLTDAMNFGGRSDLWIFEREGGTHRRITQHSDVKEFCWLSDGRTIVYTMGAVTDELTAVDVFSFRFRKLVSAEGKKSWNERAPQTMRLGNEEYLLYIRDYPEEEDRQIYRIKTDGTGDTRIVNSQGSDWFMMRPTP